MVHSNAALVVLQATMLEYIDMASAWHVPCCGTYYHKKEFGSSMAIMQRFTDCLLMQYSTRHTDVVVFLSSRITCGKASLIFSKKYII